MSVGCRVAGSPTQVGARGNFGSSRELVGPLCRGHPRPEAGTTEAESQGTTQRPRWQAQAGALPQSSRQPGSASRAQGRGVPGARAQRTPFVS